MYVRRRALLLVLTFLLVVHAAPGQDGKKEEKGSSGAVVGRTRSALGTIYVMEKGTAPFLELYSEIKDGTRLLTPPGQRGVFEVREGDLRITLVGNFPELSQGPVLESSLRLKASKEHAAEIQMEQGMLLIEAGKDSAGGSVKLTLGEKSFDLILRKNSAVAIELARFLPPGTRFTKGAKTDPIAELYAFVLRGNVDVRGERDTQSLNAPVLLHWSNRTGLAGPLALLKVPEWVNPSRISDKQTLSLLNAAEKVRRRIEKNPAATQEALKSTDPGERIIGIYHAVGLDLIRPVVMVLNSDATAKVRRAAIHALRVYAGEEPDHAEKLRTALIENKFKAGQAGIFLHLLMGFQSFERNQPETYDSLIRYLQNEQLAIRELAAEQLVALVPAGKDIAFDASADKDAWAKAQAEWRKLIPEGGLPKIEKK